MNEVKYAGIADRVKALVMDSVVIMIFMVIVTAVFSTFEHVPDYARMIAFFLIFFLYDPFFTTTFGGTLGHRAIGIRVKREKNPSKNILFPLAIVRFMVKALLGLISLIMMSVNKKRKTIHDHVVGSIVVHKK